MNVGDHDEYWLVVKSLIMNFYIHRISLPITDRFLCLLFMLKLKTSLSDIVRKPERLNDNFI